MTAALRWTRRTLDGLLIVAILAVAAIAALTLIAQALGGRVLVLDGGSMEPTMPKGSYVVVLPVPDASYQVGDVVTVVGSGRAPYTHRITRLVELSSGRYVETQGDANAAPEPVVVPYANIAGRVAFFVPALGFLGLLLASPLGLAGFLFVCGFLLSLIWLIEELEQASCPVCAAARRKAEATAGAAPRVAGALAAGAAGAGVGIALLEAIGRPGAEAEAAGAAARAITPVDPADTIAGAVESHRSSVRWDSSGHTLRRAAAQAANAAPDSLDTPDSLDLEPTPSAEWPSSDEAQAA